MIPVACPDIGPLEERYVLEAVRSSWISSTGPFVDRFEQALASLCKTDFALSVTNGTAALHLALLALDVGPGDEVLVPSLSYVAVANAVTYVGATPVFVDVDPKSWCIDPGIIEAFVTRKTRGIIAVHLYGILADMDPIGEIADRHGLWVIEDAAEAHFASYKGRPAGSLATISTFSFYGNKIVTSGEGGAVTVSSEALYSKMKSIRGQGATPDARYFFPIIGHNFRLTNVACAMLCAQLERKDDILAERHRIYGRYRAGLGSIDGLSFQPHVPWGETAPWLFPILVEPESRLGRNEVMSYLKDHGVDTRPFFVPIHTLPPYRDAHFSRQYELPVTVRLAGCGIQLPTFSALSDASIDQICDLITEALTDGHR